MKVREVREWLEGAEDDWDMIVTKSEVRFSKTVKVQRPQPSPKPAERKGGGDGA